MAQQIPVSLFYRPGGYKVGAIVFDLVLSESHSLLADVTQRPVQDGSTISDHIQNQLRQGSFTGWVSNWSLSLADSNANNTAVSDAVTRVKLRGADAISGLNPPSNRADEAWQKLKDLHAARTPVQLVLGLESYDSVVITSIQANRDGDTGESQSFEISFQQIKVVTLKQKLISTTTKPLPPKTADAKSKQAQGRKKAGKQTGERT